MRRAILTLGGTAAGVAALVMFKTHPATPTAAAAPAPAPSASARAAGHAVRSSAARPQGTAASGAASGATREVAGAVANTLHGPMQIELTLSGQRITGVTILQRTNDGSESDQIDSVAIPRLTSETIAAQSARIDAVSGASYTSSGYIQSLQSALDKAGA